MASYETGKWSNSIIEEIINALLINDNFDKLIFSKIKGEINEEVVTELFKKFLEKNGDQ